MSSRRDTTIEQHEMDAFPGAQTLTAVEALSSAVRKRILSGEFRPGEFLRDAKMCEEHSTSRHTFRTAAQALVNEGLLRQIPNRGFVLPEFGPDDIVDITRMRGAIEGEAVRIIVLTGLIPQQALDAVKVMRTSKLSSDKSTLVAADRDFHRSIIDSSASVRLRRMYATLESEIELLLVQRQIFIASQGRWRRNTSGSSIVCAIATTRKQELHSKSTGPTCRLSCCKTLTHVAMKKTVR